MNHGQDDTPRAFMDRVVIGGVEFTRVDGRYLLQAEVETALGAAAPAAVPHVARLTSLLEDIVTSADTVALQVMEIGGRERVGASGRISSEAARRLLEGIRRTLLDQATLIDEFLEGGEE